MENSIYIALSRQTALRNQMDVVANNVANMNTPGFMRQNVLFKEHLEKANAAADSISFVVDNAEYFSTEKGNMRRTGNDLDMAVDGPGLFGVVGEGGQIFYTRAGNFTLDAEGRILTASGFPVAGQGGGEIVVPADAREIRVSLEGVISTEEGEIGQVMVAEFANIHELKSVGNTLLEAPEGTAPLPPGNSRVVQGMLEGSNVNGIREMSEMIDISRQYQSVQKILQDEHERQRQMIRRMSETN